MSEPTEDLTIADLRKPRKFKVQVTTQLAAADELYKLAEIAVKLRYHSRLWQEHYGATNRKNKEIWEAIADQWIKTHVQEVEIKGPAE